MSQTNPTLDDVWRLFQETDRKFQETERLMKESALETERFMKESAQETNRKFQETDQKLKQLEKLFTSQWGRLMAYAPT